MKIGMTTMDAQTMPNENRSSGTIINRSFKNIRQSANIAAIEKKMILLCLVKGELTRKRTVKEQMPVNITHMVERTSSLYPKIVVYKETTIVQRTTIMAPGAA